MGTTDELFWRRDGSSGITTWNRIHPKHTLLSNLTASAIPTPPTVRPAVSVTSTSTVDYKRFDKIVATLDSDSDEEVGADDESKIGTNDVYKIAHRLAGVVEDVKDNEKCRRQGKPIPWQQS